MKTNLTPTLNTQRPDKDGKFALRIRSTIKGVVSYHPTGIVLLTNQLVTTKIKIKVRSKEVEKIGKVEIDNHPNKDFLNRILRDKINTLEKQFLEAEILGVSGIKLKKGATIKFQDYATTFIEKEERDKSFGTKESTKTVVNKFNAFKPNILLRNITPEILSGFEYYCKTKKKANQNNTIWTATKVMKKILRAAKRDGLIDKLPIEGFVGVKYMDPMREVLNMDEILKLEKFVADPENTKEDINVVSWFLFSCYTGLRFQDMGRFKGFKDGSVLIQTIKTKQIVSFATTPTIIKAYERIADIILTNKKTNDILKDALVMSGIEKYITFHNARHTFAVTYLRKGGRLEYLQKLMGHRDIKTTSIYAKISNMDANAELQRIWGD